LKKQNSTENKYIYVYIFAFEYIYIYINIIYMYLFMTTYEFAKIFSMISHMIIYSKFYMKGFKRFLDPSGASWKLGLQTKVVKLAKTFSMIPHMIIYSWFYITAFKRFLGPIGASWRNFLNFSFRKNLLQSIRKLKKMVE